MDSVGLAVGLADDTIVIFTSDHGDDRGEHGLMLKHLPQNQGIAPARCLHAIGKGSSAFGRHELTRTAKSCRGDGFSFMLVAPRLVLSSQ